MDASMELVTKINKQCLLFQIKEDKRYVCICYIPWFSEASIELEVGNITQAVINATNKDVGVKDYYDKVSEMCNHIKKNPDSYMKYKMEYVMMNFWARDVLKYLIGHKNNANADLLFTICHVIFTTFLKTIGVF